MTVRSGVYMGASGAMSVSPQVRAGYYMGAPPGMSVSPLVRVGYYNFQIQAGFLPRLEHPMILINATQNTAITISVFMRDANTDQGIAGLASVMVVRSKPAGSGFGIITPTITDRGNGWYDLALTGPMVPTLGLMPLRITAVPPIGQSPAQENNEITINVGTAGVNVNVVQWLGVTPAALDGSGNVPANVQAVANAAAVAGAVLDAARSGHLTLGSVGEGIALAASLLQGNFFIDNVTPSPNGPTAQRLRCWTSAAGMAGVTPGGSGQGEFATFLVTTTYTGPGAIQTHKVVQQ